MSLMSDYTAKVGLSDIGHIIHGAELSLQTATDIASRIDTLKQEINLTNEINTLMEIEAQLYDIYKTINHTIEEQE